MKKDFRVVVLISGRGSNLKSLLERAENYSIVGVVSNKPEAPGLEYARSAAIPALALSRKDYGSLADFKQALFEKVASLSPDLVCLAGFMLIVDAPQVERFSGKIINIHPSLLPKFPGLDTHERAIAAKEKEHGCSVHVVSAEVDAGPLIAQAKCEVFPSDTPESLASRVLGFEHRLYPWVVNQVAVGNIALSPTSVLVREEGNNAAQEQGFLIV